mgnify:CR=1 FL=1
MCIRNRLSSDALLLGTLAHFARVLLEAVLPLEATCSGCKALR